MYSCIGDGVRYCNHYIFRPWNKKDFNKVCNFYLIVLGKPFRSAGSSGLDLALFDIDVAWLNYISVYAKCSYFKIQTQFVRKGSLLKQWRTLTNDFKKTSEYLLLLTQLRGLRWRCPQFHHCSIQNETH